MVFETIAGISIASQFVNFDHAGGRLYASRWSGLSDSIEGPHARPSFARTVASIPPTY